MRRFVTLAFVPVAAVGVALARGRKAEETPPPPPEPAPVEAPAAPPPPEAPKAPPLFPDGKLPVVIAQLPAGLPSLSAQGCNACHWEAHDSWHDSAHAHAGESKAFRDSVRTAGNSTVCTQCHFPIAAQHDQLAAGYVDGDLSRPRLEPNPSFDATLHGEGVTCAACHVRGDTIVGTHASPKAPHPVAVSTELTDSQLCATCHQLSWPGGDKPFYDTYGEWKASAFASAGVSCQDCHMATGLADGRTHGFSADHARGLSALVSMERASVQRGQTVKVGLTLQNTGAGHAIPTGNPFKTAKVDVVLLDANGKELAPAASTLFERKVEATAPYKTTSDNRIPAGGQVKLEHTFVPNVKGAAGHGALEVRLTTGGETVVLQRIGVEVL